MNTKEILTEWLRANGFDGLCNIEIGCGCDVDDLNPCGDCAMDCVPAYKNRCDPNCGSPCDFFGDTSVCYTIDKPTAHMGKGESK